MIEKVSDFKSRFNEALQIRGMKPVDLARITGISESTISQYRSGYAKPKEKKLAKLADALRVNPTWLMGLNVSMKILPKSVTVSGHDPVDIVVIGDDSNVILGADVQRDSEKAIALYELYAKASPEVQQAVDLMLKSAQPKP